MVILYIRKSYYLMSHTRITEEPIKKDHFEGPRDLRRELELQRARQGARGQVPRSQVHNSNPGHRQERYPLL